ncbi:MAG: glycerol-3-phosphate acyltransferase [Chloroflexi bacterium]|nr:glycerol-3-phosphate acyltransferase [Chloroflexota bacterium]
MDLFVTLVAGYALGAMPFAYWLGRSQGVDLTKAGTRNPGAANLFRQVSHTLGVVAALADFGKGALAVLIGHWVGLSDAASLAGGAAAVVGHWRSPLLGFRGGEGLAPAVGAALGALPLAAGIGTVAGVSMIAALRNTGWGAAFGWAVFVGVAYAFDEPPPMIWGLVGIGMAVVLRAGFRNLRRKRLAATADG